MMNTDSPIQPDADNFTADAQPATPSAAPQFGGYEARVLKALAKGDAQKTMSLSEIAHALDPDQWQAMITPTRAAIKGLARAGHVILYRKGKPADPNEIKGVYRVGLPRHD